MTESTKPRRWFRPRYGLRTLFVVVTAFSLWLGWQVHVFRERTAMLVLIEDSGGRWIRDDESTPSPAMWVRQLMGDRAVRVISLGGQSTVDIQRAQATFPEAEFENNLAERGGGMF